MKPLLVALLLSLAAFLPGCESAATIEARDRGQFDIEVENVWKKKWDWVDGVKFLERGGLYVDSGDSGETKFDRPHVLPLLKRLQAAHRIQWFAVVDKKHHNMAVAIAGRFPEEPEGRQKVMNTLNEEQKKLPLDILVQEGENWLSIDFQTPEESAFLNGEDA